jgi:hypothetical protein
VLLGPISMTSAMVVRVISRVLGLFSCKVYVKSGMNEKESKSEIGGHFTSRTYWIAM